MDGPRSARRRDEIFVLKFRRKTRREETIGRGAGGRIVKLT